MEPRSRHIKATTAPILLALAACSATPIGTNETPDDFVRAAVSWEGSHIRDMMTVWGRPNDVYAETARFSDGFARWKRDASESDCLDRYPVRQTRVCADAENKYCQIVDRNENLRRQCEGKLRLARNMLNHRCIVTATFDAAGIITEVEAFSRRCARVYADILPYLAR